LFSLSNEVHHFDTSLYFYTIRRRLWHFGALSRRSQNRELKRKRIKKPYYPLGQNIENIKANYNEIYKQIIENILKDLQSNYNEIYKEITMKLLRIF